MGNRAVIAFEDSTRSEPCIYLNWNGGLASIEAFLHVAKEQKCVPEGQWSQLAMVRTMDKMADLIADHFFDCQVGFTVYRYNYGEADYDNGDNGTYFIDPNLNIVGRKFQQPLSEEIDPEKTEAMIQRMHGSIECASWSA